MKTAYSALNLCFETGENEIPVLVVESPVVFRAMIQDFISQQNGEKGLFCFSENAKTLSIQKQTDFIYNPFDLSSNDKKLISALHTAVKTYVSNEPYYIRLQELYAEWREFFYTLEKEFPFDICTLEEADVGALLKALNLRYEQTDGSMPERILQYLSISSSLAKTKLFAFVNLKSALSPEELSLLYQEAFYRKWRLFLLESYDMPALKAEKKVIVDKDQCVIYA